MKRILYGPPGRETVIPFGPNKPKNNTLTLERVVSETSAERIGDGTAGDDADPGGSETVETTGRNGASGGGGSNSQDRRRRSLLGNAGGNPNSRRTLLGRA